jgi:hypothetical protein
MRRSSTALIVATLTACGSGASATIDADVPIGTTDANVPNDSSSSDSGTTADTRNTDAGMPGPVRVVANFIGAAAPDVAVLFQNADDSLVTVVRTDANGEASAVMAPGGSVTIILLSSRPGFATAVETYMGVEPGDVLQLGNRDPQVRRFDIKLPAVAPADATYWALMNCGGEVNIATSALIRVEAACQSADIYVSARQKVTPYRDYGSFIMPNAALPASGLLDLSAKTYTPAVSMTQELTNVPTEASFASSTVRVRTATSGFWFGAAESYPSYPFRLMPPTVTAKIPGLAVTELLLDTRIGWKHANGKTSNLHVMERAATTSAYKLDLSTVLIPKMDTAPVIGEGLITWTESGAGTVDWVYGQMRITRAGVLFDKVIHAPYQRSTLHVPVLPGEFAIYNKQASDAVTRATFLLGQSPGGYRAIRGKSQVGNANVESLRAQGDRYVTSSGPVD